ncbi:type II toxin-antitoxin system HicB family antitoxin [Shewanella oncorhynchi]|uniref:type II toxin-antitoxin system HicB family antitoxin n=1 Tax=Shewanella TaxID=22 RepID=UPI0021D90B79|nr:MULTISPECIES: type II toxin-antitoxin system HicB family antitoxin [unclassified Shewanella]MCU7965172.1 type II toxin-antitoxin system HicB family antitoxin [Shewanella sp. SW32]MCU7973162.1 type II toxin-antitoxin system HicB family antitoxin [Shewanella sp. SW29]MCU8036927.1 type II toxin-antitoxin system HicB family antitoxin [Shewanella sp. SM69]
MTKRIETQQKFMLRLPPEMHQMAKEIASEQHRSLNAEIVYRLRQAYALEHKKQESV